MPEQPTPRSVRSADVLVPLVLGFGGASAAFTAALIATLVLDLTHVVRCGVVEATSLVVRIGWPVVIIAAGASLARAEDEALPSTWRACVVVAVAYGLVAAWLAVEVVARLELRAPIDGVIIPVAVRAAATGFLGGATIVLALLRRGILNARRLVHLAAAFIGANGFIEVVFVLR